jgi:hypothetical protein
MIAVVRAFAVIGIAVASFFTSKEFKKMSAAEQSKKQLTS